MKKLYAAALAVLLIPAAFSVSTARAASEDRVLIFGDSLSDVGNDLALSLANPALPPIPPPTRYFEGRFSNGPNWADNLAEDLGLGALAPSLAGDPLSDDSLSFAYGAAGSGLENSTPDGLLTVRGLLGQVQDFALATGGVADPSVLYVVWSGSNDYLLSAPPPNSTPGIPFPPDPVATVGNVATAIGSLYAMGARRFLVPNYPDLGQAPLSVVTGQQAAATALTLAHNGILEAALLSLEASLPGIEIARLDAFSLFEAFAADPVAAGFSPDITAPGPAAGCLVPLPPDFVQDCSPISLDQQGSVFWDAQHPSRELHTILGREALRALGAPQVAVDVRPRSAQNRVRPGSRRILRVAILSTSVADGDAVDFDATEVKARSVRFGLARAEPRRWSRLRDVDRDGDKDLVLRFKVRKTGIVCGMTQVSLSGRTYDGHAFVGTDAITTVGCGEPCFSDDDDDDGGYGAAHCGDDDEGDDDDE